MDTGIVTLHRAANFGAFLQAFALQEFLRSRGRDTCFVDVDYRLPWTKRMRRQLRSLVTSGWAGQRQARLLSEAVSKHLSTCASSETFAQAFIGSDEVWSVSNSTFNPCSQFFGIDLRAHRTSAYAPSMGQTTSAQLVVHPFAAGLRRIDDLSGRDAPTVAAVTDLTRRKVARVVDPTFLIDWEAHLQPFDLRKALVVYSYALDPQTLMAVGEYAKRHGLQLVVSGLMHSWADRQLAATPFEFLGALRSAAAVATDTFHGTIFSVLMGANFVVLGRKPSNKRTGLVEELGLHSRVWTGDRPLEEILTAPPEAAAANRALQQQRKASLEYLNGCLGKSAEAGVDYSSRSRWSDARTDAGVQS